MKLKINKGPNKATQEILVYSNSVSSSHSGGNSGLWLLNFTFSTIGGTLTGKDVRIKIFNIDDDVLIVDWIYTYGATPQSTSPNTDNTSNWAVIKDFIQVGTTLTNGGSGGFLKADWAEFSNNHYENADNLRIEISIPLLTIDDAIMDIKFREPGFEFIFQLDYSPLTNLTLIADYDAIWEYNIATGESYEVDNNGFVAVGSSERAIAQYDHSQVTNGRPHIYAVNNATLDIAKYTWDGTAWIKEFLDTAATGPGPIFGMAMTDQPLFNGHPSFFAGQALSTGGTDALTLFRNTDTGGGYNAERINFEDLLVSISGQLNDAQFRVLGLVIDNQGRLYLNVSKFNTFSIIARLTYNGSGDFYDPLNWTSKIVAGSELDDGDVDGPTGTNRIGRGRLDIYSYTSGHPNFYYNDGVNSKIKRLTYDIATDDYTVTTVGNANIGNVIVRYINGVLYSQDIISNNYAFGELSQVNAAFTPLSGINGNRTGFRY